MQKLVITQAKQKPERSWLAEVSNIALQQSIADLGIAFKNFFESQQGKRQGPKVGFPQFKKRRARQSARFRKGGFSLKGNKLYLAKLGNFKVRWSRPLPSEPSSVSVLKNSAGQYHVSFVVEVGQVDVQPLRPAVGVDLGIKTFAFLSTGEKVESPGYKRLARKIARVNRHLARQIEGSHRWHRTRQRLAKLHLKVANLRKDFLHKTTTQLIRENQTVCLEDLNVSGMLKNRRLARAMAEQGWSTARSMCETKAQQYKNREVPIISRWEPTSQTCSVWGCHWGKLDLSVRSVLCIGCGAEHDRDENAAKNIERSGLELARDVNRTVSEHQSPLGAVRGDLSSHPYSTQLSLFA